MKPSTASFPRQSGSWRRVLLVRRRARAGRKFHDVRAKGANQMKALLSVSDKHGLAGFARGLRRLGYELFATGSTLKTIQDAAIDARPVSDLTGFPVLMDGGLNDRRPGGACHDASEQTDVGGPAMIRPAAKNHEPAVVVVRPERYSELLAALTE